MIKWSRVRAISRTFFSWDRIDGSPTMYSTRLKTCGRNLAHISPDPPNTAQVFQIRLSPRQDHVSAINATAHIVDQVKMRHFGEMKRLYYDTLQHLCAAVAGQLERLCRKTFFCPLSQQGGEGFKHSQSVGRGQLLRSLTRGKGL